MITGVYAASIAEIVAAFEQGSGLTVTNFGVALSVFGICGAAGAALWALFTYVPALGKGEIKPEEFWIRTLVTVLVMVFCASIFAVGSPIAS